MVADAIARHEMLMIKPHEAIHCGTVAGHVVGLDKAVVVCGCEILDPFLVDRRGVSQRRVAERIARRGLFFLRIKVGGAVGVSTESDGQSVSRPQWFMY